MSKKPVSEKPASEKPAPEKPVKVRHTSRSLERHIKAPRTHAWEVFLDTMMKATGGYVIDGDPAPHGAGAVIHLDVGGGPLVETTLSFEPPWRRAYKVVGEGTGLDMYEATFVFRDDGPECHLSWGVVVDPEPSAEGLAFLDTALSVIGGFMDAVVERAERDR